MLIANINNYFLLASCDKHGAFTYDFDSDSVLTLRSKRESTISQPSTTLLTLDHDEGESTASWSESEYANQEENPVGN